MHLLIGFKLPSWSRDTVGATGLKKTTMKEVPVMKRTFAVYLFITFTAYTLSQATLVTANTGMALFA